MKKVYLMAIVAVATIAMIGTTAAQAEVMWKVGAKGGLNIANVTGDDAPDEFDSRTGFVGGGFIGAGFNETFTLQLELLYSQEGAKADSAGNELTLKLDYIQIPLLAMGTFAASETVGINVYAGPFLGINTTAEIEASGNVGGLEVSGTVDIGDETKSVEFGSVIGAGLSFEAGGVNIILDGRWSYGFTSVDDSDEDLDLKNHFFSFMGGVAIPLAN